MLWQVKLHMGVGKIFGRYYLPAVLAGQQWKFTCDPIDKFSTHRSETLL